MAADITQKIVALKGQVAAAQKLRAEAEAGLNVAKQKLAEADAKLKALGIDPEKADVELAALEAQLEKAVAEFTTALTTEINTYNEVVTASKAVFTV